MNAHAFLIDIIIMQTIFSDNKIEEYQPYSKLQLQSTRMLELNEPVQTRFSLSPNKFKPPKKYHPFRNRSIVRLKNAQHEFEDLIKRQKISLICRQNMNDLLMPNSQMQPRGGTLVSFPSIDSRKMNENQTRQSQQLERALQLQVSEIDFTLATNLLASSCLVTDDTKKQTARITSIPKILPNRAFSDVGNRHNPNLQSSSPTLSCPSPLKKLKKGYLPYEQDGEKLWQTLKTNWSNAPTLKLQSRIVTAKIYFALDMQSLQPIACLREGQQVQIASLSKIMTGYLSILICRKYEVDLKDCSTRVPDRIKDVPGTSADLEPGDILNVEQLLYALMLPSGNDASICLAQLMGKVLQRSKKRQAKRSYFETFLAHMNQFSKELGLSQQWSNSSGLPAHPNYSSAQAIVSLSALALRNDLFRKIVSTKEIEVEIRNERYGLIHKKSWRNTNKLLDKGWGGVKTGTTDTAGHCLVAQKGKYLLGVLDCQTTNRRFTDAAKLWDAINSRIQ